MSTRRTRTYAGRSGIVWACAALLLPCAIADPPAATRADERLTAILAPRRQVVLAAEVSARVLTVEQELGQAFGSGDVLVRLNDRTYRANRQIAAARAAAAEQEQQQVQSLAQQQTRERHAGAVLKAAQANLTATQRLYDDGHASQVDLENARRDVSTAETDCELVAATTAKELSRAEREWLMAQGQLEIATHDLESCTIAAPYAGRVARVLVNQHALVDRGTPMIEIVDDAVLRAKFLVPSRLFRAVQRGRELKLTIKETGQTVAAKVSHIAAVLDPASETFEVFAEVDNAEGALRAGMNGWLPLAELEER